MFFLTCNPFKSKTCIIGKGLGMRRLITLSCLALLVTSIGCKQDSAQWKVAAALNEEKNGNSEAAIELLHTAVCMDPQSHSTKLRLADLLSKNDQGDLGLTLCDEVLESSPQFKAAWEVRSRCLMFLGRFDEALVDFQKCGADNIDKEWDELNQLAYLRGLAGCELDKALRQSNLGIFKLERQHQRWGNYPSVPIEISSIASAGLISRYTDDGHLFVMDLLNEAIIKEQELWTIMNSQLERQLAIHELENQNKSSGETDKQRVDRQEKEAKLASDLLQRVTVNLTVLLATRSLILEDQGQTELADLDRLWLDRIGFLKSDDIYNALPSNYESLQVLRSSEAILDTRGFILTQMPWLPTWTTPSGSVVQLNTEETGASYGSFRAAMRDLDIAVAAAEIHLLACSSDLVNRIEVPLEEVHALKSEGARMVAVLRNHRRQALLKANQAEAAQQDLLRIKELGFEAGPSLF